MVERVRKRPGKKSTNAKKAREAFGGAYAKEMPIPLCIEDYNRHMGGIDIASASLLLRHTADLILHLVADALLGIRPDDLQCLCHF